MKYGLRAVSLAASLLFAVPALADPIRIVLAVSQAHGAPSELPLHHATDDADHVESVLVALGGFQNDAAIRLIDPTLIQLYDALDRARAIAATHAPEDVTFLLYFSGHGDHDRIHVGAESLEMTELARRVESVPASLRVLVTDACRNYPGRPKGITTEPGFALSGDPSGGAKGVVWLFASSEGEAAQESDELEGALFTHYWVSGLRGAADANGDGRVTLGESYDFAYSQTLFRSARASGVLQHPSALFALREASPIVLTQTFGRVTQLRFPAAADAHYLVYATGSRNVQGEIWSNPDHPSTLYVPPGRYIVQRRAGDGAGAVDVSLGASEQRTLRVSEFRSFPEEQLASKGGQVIVRPHELEVELLGGTSRVANLATALAFRYGYRFDRWTLSLALVGALGWQATEAENIHLQTAGAEAMLERRFALGVPTLSIGLGAAAQVIRQSLERTDAARVAAAGYPTVQNDVAFAPGPVGAIRCRLPLGRVVYNELALRGGLLISEFGGALGPLWFAQAGFAAGVLF